MSSRASSVTRAVSARATIHILSRTGTCGLQICDGPVSGGERERAALLGRVRHQARAAARAQAGGHCLGLPLAPAEAPTTRWVREDIPAAQGMHASAMRRCRTAAESAAHPRSHGLRAGEALVRVLWKRHPGDFNGGVPGSAGFPLFICGHFFSARSTTSQREAQRA